MVKFGDEMLTVTAVVDVVAVDGGGFSSLWFWLRVRFGLFFEAGQGWLCSEEYVTISMVGSARLLSTCFLAGQPFELLHR